ncbi:MAG: hypothetical protein HFE39_08435 [Clostridiales bacterium]|jgi:hypothetical protein|nr:hypothetical protein [Clostridiales bacterium]
MDVFVEQIVKKKMESKEKLTAVGIAVAALALCCVIFFLSGYLMAFTLVLVAAAIFGAYWLITNLNMEFEYAITNGDITVDKIIARRRRKRVVSIDAKEVEVMGKYRESDHAAKSYDQRMIAARDAHDDDAWFATFHHRVHGNVLLVFSPDERTLEAIKPFLKRQVAMDAFGRDAFNRH